MHMPGGAALVLVHVGAGSAACVALINLVRGPLAVVEAIMLMSVMLRVWIVHIYHAPTIGNIIRCSTVNAAGSSGLKRLYAQPSSELVNGALRDRREAKRR